MFYSFLKHYPGGGHHYSSVFYSLLSLYHSLGVCNLNIKYILNHFLYLGYILLNIACGFLYGLVYGVMFIILYASIGLSLSFCLCRFILTHNYCIIKNIKNTFENSQIIQTLIKVLNSADGYKIIFLSRLTPVRKIQLILVFKIPSF
jgi:uncharacterized membrane protein YdjX (TVP38/TMEM64 family)